MKWLLAILFLAGAALGSPCNGPSYRYGNPGESRGFLTFYSNALTAPLVFQDATGSAVFTLDSRGLSEGTALRCPWSNPEYPRLENCPDRFPFATAVEEDYVVTVFVAVDAFDGAKALRVFGKQRLQLQLPPTQKVTYRPSHVERRSAVNRVLSADGGNLGAFLEKLRKIPGGKSMQAVVQRALADGERVYPKLQVVLEPKVKGNVTQLELNENRVELFDGESFLTISKEKGRWRVGRLEPCGS